MKKAITLFLCIMLTTGMISGCAGREEETGSSEENTAAQEDKTDQDSQTEDQETEDDGSQEEQKEEPQDQQESGQGETDASQGEGQDRDMTEDLAMSVLKEQAGTVDYTSLEELNPEPGSRIAVVLKSTRDDFWTTVRSGIEDGVKALNEKMGYTGEDQITVSFDGPADDTDVEKQIDLIDTVLSENPSILCIAAIDRQSCEAQLEMAAENDIPVIMIDSGVENGPISALCATDNYGAGAEAAKKLAEAVGDDGQIAVMTHTESAQTSQDREKGFTDEITKNHPNIEIVNISHENEDFTMEKMADAVFTLYPDVEGYFCTNEAASEAVLNAADAAGKELAIVGFDSGEVQRSAVENGTQTGFIAQNPYGMGYAAVIAGVRADLGLDVDTFINTSYQWIDSSNIENEEYSSYFYG
ncbi:MAG TPA: substrate-binding domain-containing protein [Candidatus Blautia pullistercoris]|uniref:Substrate-binding domain-containing protein n=1 Tax=Candidatus Blautia pullistercoris TaxID=2838499 RepID=A0A9D1VLV7_9FIRM|nr:substrate-binding domain-containing protein [Candidatus Blautia pullistercoris]